MAKEAEKLQESTDDESKDGSNILSEEIDELKDGQQSVQNFIENDGQALERLMRESLLLN